MYFHAEADGDAGGVVAGLSEADDTDFLTAQFDERSVPEAEIGTVAPTAVAYLVGVVLHLLGDVEDVREDHLRDGRGAVCRDIGNDDAPLFGSGGIDDVVSGGKYADVFQVGQGCDGRRIEHDFVRQQDICSGCTFKYFGGGGTFVNGTFAQAFQFVPGEVSGVGGVAV